MFIRLIWTAAACCSGIYANIYHSYLNAGVRIIELHCSRQCCVLQTNGKDRVHAREHGSALLCC
jgi:hypothetical protein